MARTSSISGAGAVVEVPWSGGTVVPITTINTACSDVGVRSITTSVVATESGMGDAGDSSNLTCCGGGVATLDIVRSTTMIGSMGDTGDSFAQSATAMSTVDECNGGKNEMKLFVRPLCRSSLLRLQHATGHRAEPNTR